MNLMIVQNDVAKPELLQRVAEQVGNVDQILRCHKKLDAVAFYKKHHPEVIVLDPPSDDRDGVIAAQLIRAALPGTQIILVKVHRRSMRKSRPRRNR